MICCDGINLTKMTDARLQKIVAELRKNNCVARQSDFMMTFAQNFGSRDAVHVARVTIAAWEHVSTETTNTEASPESFEWSNLEGGHTFHQTPSFSEWLKLSGI
jgi:hypothetical protein